MKRTTTVWTIGLMLSAVVPGMACAQTPADGRQLVPVTFTGGYYTDRRDGGRPIVLIAAALGVSPETFRRAFSGVTPARGGPPEPEQVRRNKDALLAVLAPYGITNDRLDAVSNYYRYRPQDGELWRNTPAAAFAIVKDGKIVGFKIIRHGSGYSSAPTIQIPGSPAVAVTVSLAYTSRFDTNGSLAAIALIQPKKQG